MYPFVSKGSFLVYDFISNQQTTEHVRWEGKRYTKQGKSCICKGLLAPLCRGIEMHKLPRTTKG